MTDEVQRRETFSILGKVCLVILILSVLCMVAGWIAVTGSPNPHGHPGQPEVDTGPAPWTAVLLGIAFSTGAALCFISFIIPLIALQRKKKKYSKMENAIVRLAWAMPTFFLIHAVALPPVMCYRCDTETGLCDNNKRLIDHSKGIYAIKNNLSAGDSVDAAAVNAFIDGGAPACPEAGAYTYGVINEAATCSSPGH